MHAEMYELDGFGLNNRPGGKTFQGVEAASRTVRGAKERVRMRMVLEAAAIASKEGVRGWPGDPRVPHMRAWRVGSRMAATLYCSTTPTSQHCRRYAMTQ